MWMDFTELFVEVDGVWKNLDHFYAQKLIEDGYSPEKAYPTLKLPIG